MPSDPRLNALSTLLSKAEIARGHARVGGDVVGRAVEDEFAELHHIGAVGDLQRGLGILFDQRLRRRLSELGDDAEEIGDDQRRGRGSARPASAVSARPSRRVFDRPAAGELDACRALASLGAPWGIVEQHAMHQCSCHHLKGLAASSPGRR